MSGRGEEEKGRKGEGTKRGKVRGRRLTSHAK